VNTSNLDIQIFYSDVTRKYNGFLYIKEKRKYFHLKMTTVGMNKKGLENSKDICKMWRDPYSRYRI